MASIEPAYLKSYRKGTLGRNADQARQRLQNCLLCPRRCGVDRSAGKLGICKTGPLAWVSSYNPHFGEEAPLVGRNGSGTIFFTHCNLNCIFCQNYEISQLRQGREVDDRTLADIMLELQKIGCHNINFVTPTHVTAQILSALELAVAGGLNIPLVYNSSGYDAVQTLKLLEGIIDIYMPDFKFWHAAVADATCGAPDYPAIARDALVEMHRQVGDLKMDSTGVARRGLLVRHLVLPEGSAGSESIFKFIADSISADTYVNIMTQYRPCGKAAEVPVLAKRPSSRDFKDAYLAAKAAGLSRIDRPRRVFVWE